MFQVGIEMSFWSDLKNAFFPPKPYEREALKREVRQAVHSERNEAMVTSAQQSQSRRQIDEIYRATRKAVRRLERQITTDGPRESRNGPSDISTERRNPPTVP
jgi:hypothetical protein